MYFFFRKRQVCAVVSYEIIQINRYKYIYGSSGSEIIFPEYVSTYLLHYMNSIIKFIDTW